MNKPRKHRKNLHIAIITATNRSLGGVETITQALIDILKKNGHKISIIAADSYQENHKSIGFRLIGPPYKTAKIYKSQNRKYDLVIANGEYAWGINHPNMLVWFHGSYYGLEKYLKPFTAIKTRLYLKRDALIQKISAHKKKVITVSHFNKIILQEHGILIHHVIPNGIDISRFVPNQKIPKNGYLAVGNQYGPLDRYLKGFDILDQLAEQGLDISCASNSNPDSNLRWIGKISQSEIHNIYPKFRALIFPSRFEGFGLAPLEAMACGIPVVMGPVGYAEEIKKEIPECVVDDWSYQSFHKRLIEFENNTTDLSIRCRKFAERHSLSSFQTQWLNFIENMYEVENKK